MSKILPEGKPQPCLLDRLVDNSPDVRVESRAVRQLSYTAYREAVLRDLRWLLNSNLHLPESEIYQFPHAAQSVLNSGIRNLCGVSRTVPDLRALEKQIHQAILFFEPRIIPDTLSVKSVPQYTNPDALGFQISGDLWALPFSRPLNVILEIRPEKNEVVLH